MKYYRAMGKMVVVGKTYGSSRDDILYLSSDFSWGGWVG
jgi:hypothetical protein